MTVARIIVVILFALSLREISFLPDHKLHINFFDVGQGDSILIKTPSGKNILIDGGPDLKVLEHLGRELPFINRKIDILVLTHPDSDHSTSFKEIARRYKIGGILFTGLDHPLGHYQAFLSELERQDIEIIIPDTDIDIDLNDGVVLDVIWPELDTSLNKTNNSSVVIRLMYYGIAVAMLTGDIEHESELGILASGSDLKSYLLKVPHHGSKTSSTPGFVLEVDPEKVFISVGRDNKF